MHAQLASPATDRGHAVNPRLLSLLQWCHLPFAPSVSSADVLRAVLHRVLRFFVASPVLSRLRSCQVRHRQRSRLVQVYLQVSLLKLLLTDYVEIRHRSTRVVPDLRLVKGGGRHVCTYACVHICIMYVCVYVCI